MDKKDKRKKWYAIYTKPRAEKKVFEEIKKHNIEAYLPLKKEVRQWKDRLKKVEVPLFNSYVFVKVDDKEYYELPRYNIQGFLRYVTIGGKKVEVREKEINTIKKLLNNDVDIEVSGESFEIGEKVKIIRGTLRGLTGKLVEVRGKKKFLIRIESLKTNLLVEINKETVVRAV